MSFAVRISNSLAFLNSIKRPKDFWELWVIVILSLIEYIQRWTKNRERKRSNEQIKVFSRGCIDMIRRAFNFNNAGKLIGYRWRSGVPMTARTQFPRTQHTPLAVSRRSAACMYDNYVALQALMVAKFTGTGSTVDWRLATVKLLNLHPDQILSDTRCLYRTFETIQFLVESLHCVIGADHSFRINGNVKRNSIRRN